MLSNPHVLEVVLISRGRFDIPSAAFDKDRPLPDVGGLVEQADQRARPVGILITMLRDEEVWPVQRARRWGFAAPNPSTRRRSGLSRHLDFARTNAPGLTRLDPLTALQLASPPGSVILETGSTGKVHDEHMSYPFIPKSNRKLSAGDFWAIPLRDDRFACGRVMKVPAFGPRNRTGMVVGLMDWVGDQEPTFNDLAGKPVLAQAKSRFEAISKTGGMILGNRPLELDGLVSTERDDERVGAVDTVWGWAVIASLAEQTFIHGDRSWCGHG